MALTRVRGGTGSATNTAISVVFGAAPASGNVLVAFMSTGTATSNPALGTGWTHLTQWNTVGSDKACLVWKVCGAGESTTQTPVPSISSSNWNCSMTEWSGADTTTPFSPYTENVSAVATPTTSGTCDPPDGVERVAIGCCGVDGARTFSAHKINASATGVGNILTPATQGTAAGGCASCMWERADASTVAGDYSSTVTLNVADDSWIGVYLLQPAAAATPLPPFMPSTYRRPLRKM